jgi:hypothetical protein
MNGEIETALRNIYCAMLSGDGQHNNFVLEVRCGICFNVGVQMETLMDKRLAGDWLRRAFSRLGLDKEYPVKHPHMLAGQAYALVGIMWPHPELKPEHREYAENRVALLRQLIDLATTDGV